MRAAATILVLLAGCGPDGGVLDAGVPDLSGADFAVHLVCRDDQIGDAGLPPTLGSVQQVFDDACVTCHCCGDNLELTGGKSFAQLVGRVAPNSSRDTDESCGGLLVKPGDPSASYLYQKISTVKPCAGQPMPLQEFTFVPLAQCEQDVVRRWISAGAPND